MKKYTNGPWKFTDLRDRRGCAISYSVWQKVSRPFLKSPMPKKICSLVDGTTEENLANAQLMASAPDLVEALESFLDNSSVQVNQPHECEKAEAALKKAGVL